MYSSKRKVIDILTFWILLAIAIVVLSRGVYGVAQQLIRQSANDPQIQMAEEAGTALAGGSRPQSLVYGDKIDMTQSLAPYLIVFNEAGEPVVSGVQLDGEIPRPPSVVFPSAEERGENRFSWQPKSGVRSAAVLVHYSGKQPGFVLSGRSLREIENREQNILALTVVSGRSLS